MSSMKIALLAPSIYMSPIKFGDMIFAPRDLSIELADGLVDRGHEVYFFTAHDITTKAKLIPGDKKLLLHDYVAGSLGDQQSERLQWGYLSTLKHNYEFDLTVRYEFAKKNGLDIVHSYHERLAHFWQECTDFPTVYTLHDPLPLQEITLLYWLLDRFKAHHYVAISDRQKYLDQIGLNFVGTVYHGLNLKKYIASVQPGSYLTFMARLIESKGISDAIRTAKTTNIPLWIASSVRDENKNDDYYFQKIVKPEVDNQLIRLTDFMTGDGKSEFFKNSRAFIFPIHWEEPFGLVMIEAMACGTPVIAYNRGSVSEVVRDGVTGFIIDPDNQDRPGKGSWVIKKQGIEGLVEAVKRVGEIDRMACRKHVEEHFTVEKMVDGYESVYKKIVAQR